MKRKMFVLFIVFVAFVLLQCSKFIENKENITEIIDADGNIIRTGHNGIITLIDPQGKEYNCPDKIFMPIITVNSLKNIELNKNYCLGIDIDLSGQFEEPFDNFTGTLDGNHKKIIGLYIEKKTVEYIGLFAKIGNGGTVKNLIIENPTVIGENNVGALAGKNEGTIKQVGITVINNSAIVEGAINVGGLVGQNSGTIENSYTNETIKGMSSSGGLVGDNSGTITKSYASGKIEGTDRTIGGLVGLNAEGTIHRSYFDITSTGQQNGIGYAVGENQARNVIGYKTNGSMIVCYSGSIEIIRDDFRDWDFTIIPIWTMEEGHWPTLAWENN